MDRRHTFVETAFAAAGHALAPVFGLVAAARGGRRGLHPRGTVLTARLRRLPHDPTGARWVDDDPGEVPVAVRLSRSAGLPPPLPDVLGLSVRVPLQDGSPDGADVGDLLLSSAPAAPVARHVLRPALRPTAATYTCLVPFSTDRGSLMVGALPRPGGYTLATAAGRGPWQPFAVLDLDGPHPDPGTVRDLDAVLHPLPGLRMPPALQRLREPSYARSRAVREAAQG